MKIFQNYIAHIPQGIYEVLLGEGIIDGLKFPGTGASPDTNQAFIDLARSLNCLVDNHGWNGITAQLHDVHFCDHITDFSGLEDYLNLPNAWKYSSHIGAKPQNLPPREISQQEFDELLLTNLEKIRKTIFSLTGKQAIIYGEGVFPYYHDPRTTSPSFINRTLKSRGLSNGLDGLVLDICHSTIAAKFIERIRTSCSYSFENYLYELDTSQVKIIHLSGFSTTPIDFNTTDFSNDKELDPHLSCTLQDFLTLKKLLRRCPNAQQISNEIAYSWHWGNPVTVFDYCYEALLTWYAITSCYYTIESLREISDLIANELQGNYNNLYKTIQACKKFLD